MFHKDAHKSVVNVIPYSGLTMVAASIVTAVCARAAPFKLLPVLKTMLVCVRKLPSKCDVVSNTVALEVCQKMFSALAPPTRWTAAPGPASNVPAICIIQMSVGVPSKVRESR